MNWPSADQMSGKPKSKSGAQTVRQPPAEPPASEELISGRWLLRAASLVVVLAFLCAYLTLCLLFYQGQWQVVFQPSRAVTSTPAALGLKYDEIRFDTTGSGDAQLTGWWIPAEIGALHADRTLLFLHDRRGSISDTTTQLRTLHSLGVNIFAFDYRGFGRSIDTHPSEARVYEDADAAWNYLTDIRHVDPRSIFFYGVGIGATIAAESALRHPQAAALVLENPAPPALSLIAADARTSLLPVRWLFRDRFEIGPRLQELGIEFTQSTAGMVATGTAPPSPIVVQAESRRHPGLKLLLFLGPSPIGTVGYVSSLNDLLASL